MDFITIKVVDISNNGETLKIGEFECGPLLEDGWEKQTFGTRRK